MAGEWEIVMPRLSDTMTEGTVSRWLKRVGDRVEQGEPVVEVETEKATLEIVAETDGFLVEISTSDGAVAPTGKRIGLVAAELRAPVPAEAEEAPAPVDEIATPTAEAAPAVAAGSPPGEQKEAPGSRIHATPVARKLARELDLDLRSIGPGRGPLGRILRTDVERAAAQHTAATPGSARAVSRRHAAMARRMSLAKQAIPHFYLSAEIDATRLVQLREDMKSAPDEVSISVTTLVVKACALALRAVPAVNAAWRDDGLVVNEHVSIGIAVALDSGELLVPVITDADTKGVREIQAELSRLAEKARRLELAEREMSGGTFTVSNMGMLGVDSAYAIVNPPESGILAVGSVRETVALRGGEIIAARAMTVSLSGDHRVYSGATGAEFLRCLRGDLENPISRLLE